LFPLVEISRLQELSLIVSRQRDQGELWDLLLLLVDGTHTGLLLHVELRVAGLVILLLLLLLVLLGILLLGILHVSSSLLVASSSPWTPSASPLLVPSSPLVVVPHLLVWLLLLLREPASDHLIASLHKPSHLLLLILLTTFEPSIQYYYISLI
jgi:hypothetical protein